MRRAAFVVAAVLVSSAAPLPRSNARAATPPLSSSASSPFSLTAADGTGLALVKMSARGVVDEPLAFTELVLTFENPSDRTLEGTFRITLPPGAAVSRFAMRVGDVWQEGEVVALDFARRIYEDFLHRRQDPALLEQAAGNEFSARVFPIPAKGTKEVVVSWSQELVHSGDRYVLPLAGLPELGTLDVSIQHAGAPVELHKTHYVPSKDLEVEQAAFAGRLGVRDGGRAIVRVTALEAGKGTADPVSSALVLVDTSASRALGFDAQVAVVQKVLGELGSTPVTVAAFDQSVELLYEGAASGAGVVVSKKLHERRALGASDLQAALKWAAARSGRARVVLVTDGVATAGSTEGGELIAATLALKKAGVERLDAIVVGGIRDGDRLARLVTAGLPKDGIVADGSALDAKEIARKLGRTTRSGISVAVQGATWSWPKKLDGMQPGDEALVYIEGPADKPLGLTVGGRKVALPASSLGAADPALLERACVRARIGSLLGDLDTKADGPAQKKKLKDEIVALSTAHRVLSPFTALLILETEDQFVEYGLDRTSLADVLTVGDHGVARLHRSDVVLAAAEPVVAEDLRKNDDGADKGKTKAPDSSPADETGTIVSGVGDLEEEPVENVTMGGAAGYSASSEAFKIEAKPADTIVEGEAMLGLSGSSAGGGGTATIEGHGSGAGMMAMHESVAIVERVPVEDPHPTAPRTEGTSRNFTGLQAESPRGRELRDEAAAPEAPAEDWAGGDGRDPYEGTFAEVMALLASKKNVEAVAKARGWREEAPGDVMALVAYGTALEASGDLALAARAYGSIIDLFPARADLRRFAGERLEHIGDKTSLALAIDTYEKAAEQRPDHPESHRLLAFARLKKGEPKAAFEGLEKALAHEYPDDRFEGVDRILREDLGLVGAAWSKAEPARREEIRRRVRKAGGKTEDAPSLRFVLNWETDANDVDFHILDAKGGHAFYSQKELPSGGELYADVTTGYGPECFTIRKPASKRAGPYKLKAHYFSRGPMGYGMGKLEIITHDGKGGLTFEERPFVVMVDEAFVDLGEVTR